MNPSATTKNYTTLTDVTRSPSHPWWPPMLKQQQLRSRAIDGFASCFSGPDFCLIFGPRGYDDPESSVRETPAVSQRR
jgi:hypothetical protein